MLLLVDVRMELNLTEEAANLSPSNTIPLVGYPGPIFTTIHVAGLTSLSISTAVAITLLIYLCGFSGSVKDQAKGKTRANGKRTVPQLGEDAVANRSAQPKKTRISFWKWNIGERFVVYIALCDLCHAISHILDHAYIIHTKDHPPDLLCATFAFFLHNFFITQWFVILATAVSACSLIVFNRKLTFGRYDWRFLTFAFGVPLAISVTAFNLGLLGASGGWCLIHYGATVYTQIVNTFHITSFALMALAYGAIWIKIQRTSKLVQCSTTERYQNSAKVMLIFVAAFIIQWWPYILYNIWYIFDDPPPATIILTVIFVNLGGIYNSIAYTIIRRRLQRQKSQNFTASCDNIANTTTSASCDNIANTTTSASSLGDIPCTVSAPRAPYVPARSRIAVVLEVPDVPPDVRNDPDVASQVMKVWSVPIVPGVSHIAQMASEHQRPDSDAGETQAVGRTQMHTYL